MRNILVLLIFISAAGCSLMGVGDLQVTQCQTDNDCEAFNQGLGDREGCSLFICEVTTGDCVNTAIDKDGDEYISELCGGLDCDDSDPLINPDVAEVCGNLVDENCDGIATDLDCDGVDTCVGVATEDMCDCNDQDSFIGPMVAEVCGNLVDENCDGRATDLDCDGFVACEAAGETDCDCDDSDSAIGPRAREECNGLDDNCDGLLNGPDEDDDGDGRADSCAGSLTQDCDDEDQDTYLGAPELCDGIDNDCVLDGQVRLSGGRQPEPSEDRDGDGHASLHASCYEMLEGEMAFPRDDCNDEDPRVYPGATELCDGLDNNCDGFLDNSLGSQEAGSACLLVGVDTAGFNTCAIRPDETVACWGSNVYGELSTVNVGDDAAIVIGGLSGVTQVAGGVEFTCALHRDELGSDEFVVSCLGPDHFLRASNSNTPAFGRISGLEGLTALTASTWHACVIHESGEVSCWGQSPFFNIDGETNPRIPVFPGPAFPPTKVPGLEDALQIDAGETVSCALRTGGEVYCWGSGWAGQLGPDVDYNGQATIPLDGVVVQVSCGRQSCCAVIDDGTINCWGDNTEGQLGEGTTDDVDDIVEVLGLDDATHVECEEYSCCALRDGGQVSCWGSNLEGELAQETLEGSPTPLEIEGLEGIIDIAKGTLHACAFDGTRIYCWGDNDFGQLGRGRSTQMEHVPQPASSIANSMEIEGSCFRLPDLSVRCAQADGFSVPSWSVGSEIVDMAMGRAHQCAVTFDGEIICTGDNSSGQLGSGGNITDAVEIVCGDDHCCTRNSVGSVLCWGASDLGQLGVTSFNDSLCGTACSTVPVYVLGLPPIRQLAAGENHTCALSVEGELFCWGDNAQGQVSSSFRRPQITPVLVSGLPADDAVAQVAASAYGDSTCAVLESGAVLCWGASIVDDMAGGADPWPIPGVLSASQAAMSNRGLCLQLESGALRYIGPSNFDLSLIIDSRDISCAAGYCCTTRTSGQTLCWGDLPEGFRDAVPINSLEPLPLVDLLVDN